MTNGTQLDYKLRFAKILQAVPREQRLAYAVHVAREVVGKEDADRYPLQVVRMGQEWPHDPIVIEEITRLDSIPQTRERWLQQVWENATDKHAESKDRNIALRLYGEGNGWLRQTVKDVGDPAEWTKKQIDMYQATQTPVET